MEAASWRWLFNFLFTAYKRGSCTAGGWYNYWTSEERSNGRQLKKKKTYISRRRRRRCHRRHRGHSQTSSSIDHCRRVKHTIHVTPSIHLLNLNGRILIILYVFAKNKLTLADAIVTHPRRCRCQDTAASSSPKSSSHKSRANRTRLVARGSYL
jgi:hypothetical protein